VAQVSTRQIFRAEGLEPTEVAKRSLGGSDAITIIQGDDVVVINANDLDQFVDLLHEVGEYDAEPEDGEDFDDDLDEDEDLVPVGEAIEG